jgi:uncharacterized membrane protein
MTSEISTEDQLWFALGYCLFLLLMMLAFRKFPPKKINWFYGYRTRRSMANEEVWKVANTYSMEKMVQFCLYSFAVPLVCYFIFPEWNFVITVIIHTVLVILVIPVTENHLNKYFDKNGKRQT